MDITGIICEYNPLHLGHKKQIDSIRKAYPDGGIVCLMSGNYVQRGSPAILDKMQRAKAAVLSGADLVLELPVTAALSSAEGFASSGVQILSGICNRLCFGTESADPESLWSVARALLTPEFSCALKETLAKGVSFPVGRQQALRELGVCADILSLPNNILAVEYCKAILVQGSSMEIMPICRHGNYHDTLPNAENPSATALRELLLAKKNWQDYVPEEVKDIYQKAPLHSIAFGEQAILSRLRTMTDDEFETLPYGSEGLWRKLMHASRKFATLEEIISNVKSKRYTRTRIDRMVLCAFLGITQEIITTPAPYVRVLGLNDKGREILKRFRAKGDFPNIGETQDSQYQLLENRWGDLYGLFGENPEAPGAEQQYRIYYKKHSENAKSLGK